MVHVWYMNDDSFHVWFMNDDSFRVWFMNDINQMCFIITCPYMAGGRILPAKRLGFNDAISRLFIWEAFHCSSTCDESTSWRWFVFDSSAEISASAFICALPFMGWQLNINQLCCFIPRNSEGSNWWQWIQSKGYSFMCVSRLAE